MDMTSNELKGLDTALELIKQIISLSAGIIALSGTFLKDMLKQVTPTIYLLFLSWFVLILSIVFGLNTISIMVTSTLSDNLNWYKDEGKYSGRACRWLFVAGIIFFMIFAGVSIFVTPTGSQVVPKTS